MFKNKIRTGLKLLFFFFIICCKSLNSSAYESSDAMLFYNKNIKPYLLFWDSFSIFNESKMSDFYSFPQFIDYIKSKNGEKGIERFAKKEMTQSDLEILHDDRFFIEVLYPYLENKYPEYKNREEVILNIQKKIAKTYQEKINKELSSYSKKEETLTSLKENIEAVRKEIEFIKNNSQAQKEYLELQEFVSHPTISNLKKIHTMLITQNKDNLEMKDKLSNFKDFCKMAEDQHPEAKKILKQFIGFFAKEENINEQSHHIINEEIKIQIEQIKQRINELIATKNSTGKEIIQEEIKKLMQEQDIKQNKEIQELKKQISCSNQNNKEFNFKKLLPWLGRTVAVNLVVTTIITYFILNKNKQSEE